MGRMGRKASVVDTESVINAVVSDAPALRWDVDDIAGMGERIQRRRRARWMTIVGGSMAAIAVIAVVVMPRLPAESSQSPQSAPAIQPAADATPTEVRSMSPTPEAPTTAPPTVVSTGKRRSPSPAGAAKRVQALPVRPNTTYQIESAWAHAVMEVPGVDNNHTDNARVDLADNKHQKDQYWRVSAAPASGYVLITNAYSGMSLSTEDSSTDNFAKLVQARTDAADPHQQWRLEDAGDNTVHIFNRASGKAMDLLGEDRDPPFANGTSWNTYFIQQYDLDPTAKDMHWRLRR
jgi:hypothetical protein